MHSYYILQILAFAAIFLILAGFMSLWLARSFPIEFAGSTGHRYGFFERNIYRILKIDPHEEMTWKQYICKLLLFNLIGFVFLFGLLLIQQFLPHSYEVPAVSVPLAFNIAISFVTNTNWQSYAGETTLTPLTQMLGLTVQNFLSAATGFAVMMVLIRGIVRESTPLIGNFWVDMVKSTLYLFLPISFIVSLFLVWQGVPQSFNSYPIATTLEGGEQVIPLGLVASQESIKMLGTNGGGYYNTNSAHPFENPTPMTNFVESIMIVLIPAAQILMYGYLLRDKRHGWVLLITMLAIWFVGISVDVYFSLLRNPVLDGLPFVEGTESGLTLAEGWIWSVTTTATASGSTNSALSSMAPIAGGVSLFNMMLGEVVFGGVGVGFCSLMMFVIATVFLSGLMVGRTPEYQGKKIEKREIRWVMIAILIPSAAILLGSGISSILPEPLSSLGNKGPHGLTEILYAFTSAAANNGSAFAGLNANTNYYNIVLGIVMLIGRLSILVPSVAVAGNLALKKKAPYSLGTFSTNSVLFACMLVSIIIIIGALTFFPALSLGPLVEQILMNRQVTF
jgi:K+-transporting ATPase ATPase A chain